MEIAQKLAGLMQLKKSDTKTKETNDISTELRNQIKDCKALIECNESMFNMEQDPSMIDAHIFAREGLMVRYNHLIRQAKQQNMRVWDLALSEKKVQSVQK